MNRQRDLVLTVALCGLALALGCFPMSDPDTWWHLAAGRIVLTSGWPSADVWTWTADKPWIDLYWLPQVIFYGLFQIGGASALVMLKMAAAVGIAALVLASVRKQAPGWAVVLATAPSLVLITGRLRERPELFSLIFLTAFLVIIARAEKRPRLLLALPALQVLWVNSHGLFVLGPALLAAHLLAALIERRPGAKLAALTLALSLMACLVNPYGFGVFTHLAQQAHQLDDGLYRRSIVELQTFPELLSRGGWIYPYSLAALITFAVGLWSFAARRAWPRVFPALVFVASAYLALRSVRLVPIFAIVSAVVSLENLGDAFEARKRSPWPIVAVTTMVALVLSGIFYRWTRDGRTVGFGEARGAFAHGACAFLAEHGPARVIAANIGQASVCTWHLRSDQRQFLVSRIEPAEDDAFRRYVEGIGGLLHGRIGWDRRLGIDSENAPAILIEHRLKRAAENLERDHRWRLAYRDNVASVFLPSKEPSCTKHEKSQVYC